jgi:hypothetical protein
MTHDELEAIRARDAESNVVALPIDPNVAGWAIVDRRALLARVDEMQAYVDRKAEECRQHCNEVDRLRFEWQVQVSKIIGLELTNDELREELKLRECEGPAHVCHNLATERAEVRRLLKWQQEMIDAVNSGKVYRIRALIEEARHE